MLRFFAGSRLVLFSEWWITPTFARGDALHTRKKNCARHGVSVLEVLFAIGIVSVGLLGVIMLIPVAGARVTRGTIADAADRVGRNAVREFETRMMQQPDSWTQYNPASGSYVEIPGGLAFPAGQAFCIDPLFIGHHVGEGTYIPNTPAGPHPTLNAGRFPYYQGATPRMRRISLRNLPDGFTGISLAQAFDIFTSGDDVDFGPYQTRRFLRGHFSWMATLSAVQHTQADLYILSVVVFHRRDLSMTMQHENPASAGPDNERLVDVILLDGGGYGGGEMTLRTIERTTPPDHNTTNHHAEDLQVQTGDWLMLSGSVPTGSVPSANLRFFRWYRVIAADSIPPEETGPYTRNVTLHGPDWHVTAANTQATLLNNVVAVYEKTIRLERSSLWSTR